MLQKQPILINFAKGLDTKTDPFQIGIGSFQALENSIFTTGGRLTKRNGYRTLAPLPSPASFVTTFNGDLSAVGTQIQAYSPSNDTWVSKGQIQPLGLSTLPLIRNNLNQTQADSVVAPNGLICTVYTETNGSTNTYKYAIADSVTGQNIVAPTAIATADATYGTPKVFLLGQYFIIVYTTKTGPDYRLSFFGVSSANPTVVTSQTNITTSYTPATTMAFGAVVFSNNLYVAWNGASASGVKMATVSMGLAVSATVTRDASHQATLMSVTADIQNSVVWVSYYNSGTSTGYTLAVNPSMALLASYPVQIIASGTIINLASAAQSGIETIFYETSNTASGVQTNFISSVRVTQSTAAVSSPVVVLRSVGLASKAFIIGGTIYLLVAYSSPFQPTYFLINASLSTSAAPVIIAKLAYENGGGYLATGLPSVTVSGETASVAYLYKDLIQALSNANAAGTTIVGGIYSQLGVNLATFTLGSEGIVTNEIGANLNISGGYLIAYDGYLPVENGFHLWPDSVQATWSATGGAMNAQPDGATNTNAYSYQVTYEWSDNQGNVFRSAPSIPVFVTTTGSAGAGSVSLVIPTLRVTSKVANPVKIVIYRWSVGQQTYHQTTSILVPVLNSTTTDSVTYLDTLSDSSIRSNDILYTTGGVIENIGPPATAAMALFDDRLWLVDAEDPNLLWFSKQVIEATPVEMSDLLTVYVAPSIGATGPTGPIRCLSAMDDKLIIFKGTPGGLYYLNGTGPDNTGANSQYSQPVFITSMVGCSNQKSIVFQPQGLMFEFSSESGNQIWLLGRNLETTYIGAPVEALTKNSTVMSAIAVPGTNEVRFNMSDGTTLKYDYFYGQWGTHSTNAVSSTLYQALHTYIDASGAVFQETPGKYLDGTNPVLLSFSTGWINVAGIRGYQRAYFFYLLGQYLSPFKLSLSIGYDYESAPTSFAMISPTNFSPAYGAPEAGGQYTTYGTDGPYGGPGNILNWRVFMKKQLCSSFQITAQEIYDPSFGVVPGAGFTLSGLSLICGIKSAFKPISGAHSVGSS